MNFGTQIKNLDENFKSNKIISVLIADEIFDVQEPVSRSERNACYDGVISLSSEIAIIIENKPSWYNVWEEQLSPNVNQEDVEIIETAAGLKWRDIIKALNNLITNNLIGRAEKEIVFDFLNFIDKNFPLLNPYDNFSVCKDDITLMNRRIKNLLEKEIAKNEDDVGDHRGWGHYIKTTFPEIKMIGFRINNEEKNWKFIVELWFGDTLSQSRELYKNKIDYNKICSLEENGWKLSPNFHISFMQKHLIWLKTPTNKSKEDYIKYWIDNISDIKQYSKVELNALLEKLHDNQIVEIGNEDNEERKKEIDETKRNKFYISPGFGLTYSFVSKKVKELDSEKKLSNEIKGKVLDGLSILGKEVDFLK